MKELGQVKKILGLEVHRSKSDGVMHLKQKNYIEKILTKFKMQDSKSTRQQNRKKKSKKFHMQWLWDVNVKSWDKPLGALKWLLRYLRGTSDIGLTYKRVSEKVTLKGYVDADYASSKDTRRSTTSYVFQTNGDCISWKLQLQFIVALSTTEAEFMATTKAFKEAI
ncbi:secreted RxLR effector protein 161-like [Cannabis sativa]|uniref:secreted RxLR effector protein 161-like n=1 Tax=Cannabis sativa TaxID=3483 RepID=UPI0029C9B36D|nr:secreted RxLR effector protein 161-like [Cannabis sativa]